MPINLKVKAFIIHLMQLQSLRVPMTPPPAGRRLLVLEFVGVRTVGLLASTPLSRDQSIY